MQELYEFLRDNVKENGVVDIIFNYLNICKCCNNSIKTELYWRLSNYYYIKDIDGSKLYIYTQEYLCFKCYLNYLLNYVSTTRHINKDKKIIKDYVYDYNSESHIIHFIDINNNKTIITK